MFEASEVLYLYVETPLHAGSGTSVGLVDLPIQRERVTNYPLLQASGLKGKLRAEAIESLQRQKDGDAAEKVRVVFGPEGNSAYEHAGALSPGDARLLLFPLRSLIGVFAWTTSRNVLARFRRDLEAAGALPEWKLDALPDKGEAWVVDDHSVVADGRVLLEEFAFTAVLHDEVKAIAAWLADNAFPQSKEYDYFREKIRTSLAILPEDAFRDFVTFSTEIVTRIRIDQEKKTVATGALWTEEHLPSETVLCAAMHASRPRTKTSLFNGPDGKPSAARVLDFIRELKLDRLQLGGDETVGRGMVKLQF